ncbi:MAG TPA: metallophosphoesterase [Opitutaceae bacterium]
MRRDMQPPSPLACSGHFAAALCRPDEPVFAIGDVHGKLTAFNRALDYAAGLIDEGRAARAILLGDLIDRGQSSLACLRLVADFRKAYRCDLLLGNHEQFMFATLSHPDAEMRRRAAVDWGRNGGEWAAGMLHQLPDMLEHLSLDIDEWAPWAVTGNVLFVHAGVPAGADDAHLNAFLAQGKLEMPRARGSSHPHWAWIRSGFLEASEPWPGHFVVHGHTKGDYTARPAVGRMNLDASKRGEVASALVSEGELEFLSFGDG